MPVNTRKLALAVAIASSSAFGLAGMAASAHAQDYGARAQTSPPTNLKKKKAEEPAKRDYSKAFVEAYGPLSQQINAEGADASALKAALPAVEAAASTPDDKFALGQAIYSIGQKSEDLALQRRGVDMMLASRRVAPEKLGVYSFLSGQLAYQAQEWAAARTRVQEAVAAGYTDNEPQAVIAETYFNEDNYAAGLEVLDKVIAAKAAAGEAVSQDWIKRGLAMAYEGDLSPQATKFAQLYVQYYPTKESWGDAIAIQRTFYELDGQALLDLMRLADRTKSLRSERDYVDYINSADARRLPGEVQRVIADGVAGGHLKPDDVFIKEARSVASSRVAADKADLPDLERDARASSASGATLSAAGDAFLSYEEPAKAEEFYQLALTKPGIDTAQVLTRLGIAQVDQGKGAEAAATLAKVEGARQAIARLWALYAKQQAM